MLSTSARSSSAPRPLSRLSAPIGGLLVLLVVAGGAFFLLAGSGPLPLDTWWHARVSAVPGTVAHGIAGALALVGGQLGAAACFAIACAALLAAGRRRDCLAVALAGVLGVVCSETFKRVVERPRPPEPFFSAHGFSYPSGHSMAAAALAGSLALVALGSRDLDRRLVRATVALASVWTVVMMWSRTALHVHWLSDTLAGAALGIGAALLARSLCVPSGSRASGAA